MGVALRGGYRVAMSCAAGVAGVATRVPLAPERWRALGDRLGRLPPADRAALASAPALWVHAASVGELAAVRPLLGPLRARFPGRLLLVSTTTRTGLEQARALPEAHVATLLPLDARGPVAALLAAMRLEGFLFTETEIWPTLLAALAARKVPALMVSGRVGVASAARARWLRPLYRPALAQVFCCMQTAEDAARIIALGADPRRVQVAGSLKYDAGGAPPPPAVAAVAAALAGRPVIVAGSTHAGEDEALCDALLRVAAAHRDVVLVLAPRHPERFAAVADLVRARGIPLAHWADVVAARDALPPGHAVLLVDVLGVLAQAYALGQVAFVGGSLVPIGGHNVLEPARAARPVIVGPHTASTGEVVERLVAAGGARRVATPEQLAALLAALLDDPAGAADMGRRAAAVAAGGEGAVERHMKIIATRLGQAGFAREAAGG